MTARRLGIDVGGTKAHAVVIDDAAAVLASAARPTPRGDGSLPVLVDVLVQLVDELGPADELAGVGIGVPGLVDRHGVLRAAPNLDGVADFAVAELVADRIGRAVAVDSDATCALVAEAHLGAARGRGHAILVTLGTGIGGALLVDGAVYRGANGFAGEFGHMVVDPDGPPCPCGRRGCWERYASGSGLAMLARAAAVGGRLRDVARTVGDAAAIRGEHVLRAARDGDPDALAVIDEFGRWVAVGLVNLTNAFDPEVFVLGGGLATGDDVYLAPIRHWFGQLVYEPELRPWPEIVFATAGPLAGAIGAALL